MTAEDIVRLREDPSKANVAALLDYIQELQERVQFYKTSAAEWRELHRKAVGGRDDQPG